MAAVTGKRRRAATAQAVDASDRPKKRQSNPTDPFSAPPPIPVDDVSDGEYVKDQERDVESDEEGVFAVARHYSQAKHGARDTTTESRPYFTEFPDHGKSLELDGNDIMTQLDEASTSGTNEVVTITIKAKIRSITKKDGFTDLPYEVRKKCYNFMFRFGHVAKSETRDFSGSSHFLRTCKMVHDEGTAVLYGENSFHFSRNYLTRGNYFDKVWTEIAYKDIRRFLTVIEPRNLAKIKHISFALTDAPDNRTRIPQGQIAHPRFVDDPIVREIFRMIGANTTLKTFALQFSGRAYVNGIDRHFLRAVTSVKCYKLITIVRLFARSDRCAAGLRQTMKQVMCVRDEDGEMVNVNVNGVVRAYKVPEVWNQVGFYGAAREE